MRILIKFPTRSRPDKAYKTLETYVKMASDPKQIGILVSCDIDDTSMTSPAIKQRFEELGKRVEWLKLDYKPNKTKIEACNAGMHEVDYAWDIVLLASDDMIPQVHGYDATIRLQMRVGFPDTDGILWFNDGSKAQSLNTLSILGRKMYESFGYIYHPAYKSFYCDTEFTDLCLGTLKKKCSYVSTCIIRHEHPVFGLSASDELYMKNNRYWNEDMYTYVSRKQYAYDWSVLIPTIAGREQSLTRLQDSIREKVARLYPELRYEIRVEFDRKTMSIGAKRQKLLQSAQGKYMSFIDDDDNITDAYIEDLRECIRGNYSVMQLWGTLGDYKFTHTISVKPTDKMSDGTKFLRPPNHLNPMFTDIAKLISFQDATYGEDLDWALRLSKHGFLNNEYRTSRTHYLYTMGSHMVVNQGTLNNQMQLTPEDMLKRIFTPREKGLRLGPHGFVSR